MITIDKPNWTEALHVAANMRESDRMEIAEGMPGQEASLIINALSWHSTWCVYLDGVPVVIFDMIERFPGNFSAVMFATDDWRAVSSTFFRWVKRQYIPNFVAQGGRYVDAIPHAENESAIRFLKHAGFRFIATLPRYGQKGSDYVLMVWNPDTCAFPEADQQPQQRPALKKPD